MKDILKLARDAGSEWMDDKAMRLGRRWPSM
jgi:hypothetical protein